MNDDGTLKTVTFRGKKYCGKEYLDAVERAVREGYFNKPHTESKRECMDIIWYMWCGEDSPLFGKKKMTTFERYFIDDKATHKEVSNPYYSLRNEEATCKRVLAAFGLNPETSHIVNGHVPVKVSKGESPIKANGRLFVIDGGFAKAYQKVTGIAGYTLIYNSHGMIHCSIHRTGFWFGIRISDGNCRTASMSWKSCCMHIRMVLLRSNKKAASAAWNGHRGFFLCPFYFRLCCGKRKTTNSRRGVFVVFV